MRDKIPWHPEVLAEDARKTLDTLSGHRALRPFYLAGGTALALQLGHRRSIDLDFFTGDVLDEDVLLQELQGLPGMKVISKSTETLHLHVGGTKVSFLGYHYPQLFLVLAYEKISVADARDIAGMKLSAIASRGTKRDFIDVYFLSQQYGLKELVRLFHQKFVHIDFSDIHLLKSLTYFADGDREPMPHMIQPITWEEVKEFFSRQVPQLRG